MDNPHGLVTRSCVCVDQRDCEAALRVRSVACRQPVPQEPGSLTKTHTIDPQLRPPIEACKALNRKSNETQQLGWAYKHTHTRDSSLTHTLYTPFPVSVLACPPTLFLATLLRAKPIHLSLLSASAAPLAHHELQEERCGSQEGQEGRTHRR